MKRFFKEFSDFLKQGNMVEIATGLLLATAFNELVQSFTETFFNPVINKLLGGIGESTAKFEVAGMVFTYGRFINSIISFIIVGFVLFIVVKGYNKLLVKDQPVEEVATETELSLLKDIKELLEKDSK